MIKLLKKPGYLFDLYFIFYVKFNYAEYVATLPEEERSETKLKNLNFTLASFGEIPDELYLFFHALKSDLTFFSKNYSWFHCDLFTTKFNFNLFINQFRNTKTIIRKLLEYYFENLTEDEMNEYLNSNDKLFACIKASAYSYDEKSHLYEFFLDPDSYIQCLIEQLSEKERFLSQYYEKNYQKIFDVFNETTLDSLSQQVAELKDLSFLLQEGQTLYLSYSLLDKYLLKLYQLEDGAIYLLGIDYHLLLDIKKEQQRMVRLDSFGMALGEENRIMILQYLLEHGEASRKDFEKMFNFSGSTVYHHISILLKAGLLQTRNEGKTILYSLNHIYFDMAIDTLRKYATKRS